MPWPQTCATHCNKQFGRAIKGLVVCNGIYKGKDGYYDFRKVHGSGPLLWSVWLSSSRTTTPHRNIILSTSIFYISLFHPLLSDAFQHLRTNKGNEINSTVWKRRTELLVL